MGDLTDFYSKIAGTSNRPPQVAYGDGTVTPDSNILWKHLVDVELQKRRDQQAASAAPQAPKVSQWKAPTPRPQVRIASPGRPIPTPVDAYRLARGQGLQDHIDALRSLGADTGTLEQQSRDNYHQFTQTPYGQDWHQNGHHGVVDPKDPNDGPWGALKRFGTSALDTAGNLAGQGLRGLAHGFEWGTRKASDAVSNVVNGEPVSDETWNYGAPALEQQVLGAFQDARKASSRYIASRAGLGYIPDSVFQDDPASRISGEVADFATNFIPGVGQLQMGLQARQLARGIDQNGVAKTAAGAWDSMNPAAKGLHPDERFFRGLNLAMMAHGAAEGIGKIATERFGPGTPMLPEGGTGGMHEGSTGTKPPGGLWPDNAKLIQHIAEIHGALKTLKAHQLGLASPEHAHDAAVTIAKHKIALQDEEANEGVNNSRRIDVTPTPVAPPTYAKATGPNFDDLHALLDNENTGESGLYKTKLTKDGLEYDPQTFRLAHQVLDAVQPSLIDGSHFEIHDSLPNQAIASYHRPTDVVQLGRNGIGPNAWFSGKQDFARSRNVALKIGHELGHRLESFLGQKHFDLLYNQFAQEKQAFESPNRLGKPPTLSDADRYRFQSFSEWFAHRFADHVDHEIVRPAQINDFGRTSFDGAMARLDLATSTILRSIKKQQLSGKHASYADRLIHDFLSNGNPENLRYRGLKPLHNIAEVWRKKYRLKRGLYDITTPTPIGSQPRSIPSTTFRLQERFMWQVANPDRYP
jgi:hypothetical protein